MLLSDEHIGPLLCCTFNTSLLPKLCDFRKSRMVASNAGTGREYSFGVWVDFLFVVLLNLSKIKHVKSK